jgi:uncharacterized protein (TIGR02147 family)
MSGNYREFLKKAYDEKQSKNPRYSLRAFARDLEISTSQMVDVLNGKQGLSVETAQRVAKKLGWKPELREKFCALVQAQHGRSQLQRKAGLDRLKKSRFTKVNEDVFSYIADPDHLAILEMISWFKPPLSEATMAGKLGLPLVQLKESLARMQRLKLIDQKEGTWISAMPDVETFDDIPSTAIRQYHLRMLEKSKKATHLAVDERELQSLILSCPKKRLPELRQKIREFCSEFNADKSDPPDTVFALNIQLFPLTREIQ